MITSVYKYRTLIGIVEYKILNGEFGIDNTLHLQDTTCKHSGPNCEIEVVKSESGNCYQFSKALNQNAKDYEYFHTLEKYWATKEDAYVEVLMTNINGYQDIIEEQKTRMSNAEAKLKEMEVKEVNYLMPFSVTNTCYIDSIGVCDIIGTIRFKDGSEGYLTNSNYTAFDCDGEYIEAMKWFKNADSSKNYSKAFKLYRKEVGYKYTGIVIILILVIVTALIVTKIINKKRKITTVKKTNPIIEGIEYGFHIVRHPFDGFWDMQHEGKGVISSATCILVISVLFNTFSSFTNGYLISGRRDSGFNVLASAGLSSLFKKISFSSCNLRSCASMKDVTDSVNFF